MKILITSKGSKILVRTDRDVHLNEGMIRKEDLKDGLVKTNKGIEFLVTSPNDYDMFTMIKRGPQIITPKDAGYMLIRSGLDKNSVVWEAGAGSGAFSIQLSKIAKKIISYENRIEHMGVASKNLEMFKIQNVKLENKDAYQKSPKLNLTHIFLDLKHPTKVNTKQLKHGGMLTIYVPTINQVNDVISHFSETFIIEEVSEIIKRDWKTNNINRPENTGLTHTAFLMFLRKKIK